MPERFLVTDLLILADAGGSIGLGHLMRCLAIKNQWSYGTAQLLVDMVDSDLAPVGAESVDWFKSPNKLEEFRKRDTILLVDSYRPNADYFWLLKKLFSVVVVFDDYNRISYPVDLLICPGVYGKEMDYSNQPALVKGGPEYVILRSEILAQKPIVINKTIQKVFVTFGGSQRSESLFQRSIDVIEDAGCQAVVVTGNDQLGAELQKRSSQVFGRLESGKMAEIMASADIAVSAAGQTLNELSWLGVPTFSIETGSDQHENWEYYRRQKLSLAAFLISDSSWTSSLRSILDSETYQRRVALAERLKNLFTLTGALYICRLINQLKGTPDE
ncbi:hypothetical protein N9I66_03755 [Pseudomonadales bacterium]|nr:hypothetical protein [Pseudomonadales bacterium]